MVPSVVCCAACCSYQVWGRFVCGTLSVTLTWWVMTPKWVPGQSLPKQENVEKEISSHAFLTHTKQLLSFLLLWWVTLVIPPHGRRPASSVWICYGYGMTDTILNIYIDFSIEKKKDKNISLFCALRCWHVIAWILILRFKMLVLGLDARLLF